MHPPPGRHLLEPVCELGGMTPELPEAPNAGAATAVIRRAADGVVGTSDGLAATAPWGCLSALPGSEGHRGLAELTAPALEGPKGMQLPI